MGNPKAVLNEATGQGPAKCVDTLNNKGQVKTTDGKTQRIRVWHHGHESEGTDHKCHLTGSRFDTTPRSCECLCSNDGAESSKWATDYTTGDRTGHRDPSTASATGHKMVAGQQAWDAK